VRRAFSRRVREGTFRYNRTEIQEQANTDMKSRFAAYTLEFQEVLIGTPKAREGD
jgi:hypothetical protein